MSSSQTSRHAHRVASRRCRRRHATPLEPLEPRQLLATVSWVGDIDDNWGTVKVQGFPPSVNTNWSGNASPTSVDTIVFPAGAPAVSNNDVSSAAVATLRIDGVGAQNQHVQLSGNPLALEGANGVIFNAPGDRTGLGPEILLPIKLDTSLTVANTGVATGRLQDIDLRTAGYTLTFNPSAGDLSVYGTISGSGGIVKAGARTLLFELANTYNGPTRIDAGVLRLLGTLGATGAANGTTIAAGGVLSLEGDVNSAETFTISGTGAGGGAIVAVNGPTTPRKLSGPVTLAANAAIGVGPNQTLELSGAVSGKFGLTKLGQGTLILSNHANAFGDALHPPVIAEGTLRLGAGDVVPDTVPLSISAGAVLDLNNFNERVAILGAGAGLVKLGSGTLTIGSGGAVVGTFDGAITGAGGVTIDDVAFQTFAGSLPNTYTGTTFVKGGTLTLDKTGAIAVPGDLVIGDGVGIGRVGVNADAQFGASSNLVINAGGDFELGGHKAVVLSLVGQAAQPSAWPTVR